MANEKLFGFKFVEDTPTDTIRSPVVPEKEETSIDISSAFSGGYLSIDSTNSSENEVIEKYREISIQPEVDRAISEIVSDAIIVDEQKGPVSISLDDVEVSDRIKKLIQEEFDVILRLLHFKTKATDIFRKWYVDGRLNYHVMIDETKPKEGIQELRYIDPRKIKKVRKKETKNNTPLTSNQISFTDEKYKEFYVYNEKGVDTSQAVETQGIAIAKDSIAYANSGMFDSRSGRVTSYLHKAIRPANQLRMMEDAIVIYRITRAPERRVFYVEVGGMNRENAESHITNIMNKHKTKIVYDVATGEVADTRRHLAMTEDFWIPRRDGQGTQIDTLQSGQNLNQIEDVEYFKNKLYESLSVPKSRFNEEGQMFGRSSEISRDELKFARFISSLRSRFNMLFDSLLEKQLVLKGIMTPDDWKSMKDDIHYDFIEDNYFSEAVENDVMTTRLSILDSISDYVGRFFSEEYVMKNILRMSEDEIAHEKKQMTKETTEAEKEPNSDADSDGVVNSEDGSPTGTENTGNNEVVVKVKSEDHSPLNQQTLTEQEKALTEALTSFFTPKADEI